MNGLLKKVVGIERPSSFRQGTILIILRIKEKSMKLV